MGQDINGRTSVRGAPEHVSLDRTERTDLKNMIPRTEQLGQENWKRTIWIVEKTLRNSPTQTPVST